jgi:hypothetical protein
MLCSTALLCKKSAFPTIKRIPAIDLIGSKYVRLMQSDYATPFIHNAITLTGAQRSGNICYELQRRHEQSPLHIL